MYKALKQKRNNVCLILKLFYAYRKTSIMSSHGQLYTHGVVCLSMFGGGRVCVWRISGIGQAGDAGRRVAVVPLMKAASQRHLLAKIKINVKYLV